MKKEIIIILFFILSRLNFTSQDIWVPKSDFLGWERFNAVAFSIGNKGYVGLGNNFTTSFDDFWEYDASNDTALQEYFV